MKTRPKFHISNPGRAALAAVLGVLVLAGSSRAQTETVRLPGSSVAVYNLAGAVSISAGSGSDVTVTIRRSGPDAQRLELRTGVIDVRRGDWGKMETLRVVYPADRVLYDGRRGTTQLRVRDDGTFWGGGWNGREGRRVEISDRGRGLEASADMEISVPSGKRILVALAAGRINARNVDGEIYLDTGSGDITASGASGILNLDTGSGNVMVDGAEGDVSVDTGSGDVEARSIRGTALSLDTGSGDVTVAGVEAQEIEVDTGSGSVTLQGLRVDRIGVDTGSGEVTVETVAGSASIQVDTGSGNVTVRVPDDYAGDVQLATSSGRMVTELPITLLRRSEDEVVGRIGGGGSARIEVDTGSGDIRIHRS